MNPVVSEQGPVADSCEHVNGDDFVLGCCTMLSGGSLPTSSPIITLMLEAVQTSETSVNSYQSTRHYNPEDGHLHTRSRENLKSHKLMDLRVL
jgi:hypothetical protein